jgi:hypothetical protein
MNHSDVSGVLLQVFVHILTKRLKQDKWRCVVIIKGILYCPSIKFHWIIVSLGTPASNRWCVGKKREREREREREGERICLGSQSTRGAASVVVNGLAWPRQPNWFNLGFHTNAVSGRKGGGGVEGDDLAGTPG